MVREENKKEDFLSRLRERLSKTQEGLIGKIDRLILGKKGIEPELLEELLEILIGADLGIHASQALIAKVEEELKRRELLKAEIVKEYLKEIILNTLISVEKPLKISPPYPFIIMVIGVNGTGKTTTIAKLAYQLKNEGKKVLLTAADTFRAAAIEQLEIWGERVGCEVIRQQRGTDPSAVVFDALKAAQNRKIEVLIIDTAGRLHTKTNLMEELKKVKRIIGREIPQAPQEIMLVLDATTGQNALAQARMFKEEVGISGLILTKLDGSAKGGIIVSISQELKIPLRYLGIGEKLEDLREFKAQEFVEALFA